MFGTLGFSELIIILAIILIIFGAGRLPQIGEGIGKALKGFKKEVHEAPPAVDPNAPPIEEAQVVGQSQASAAQGAVPQGPSPAATRPASVSYQPGPEATPGTTAALMAAGAGPQPPKQARPPQPQPQPAQASQPRQAENQMQSASPAPVPMEERLSQPPPAPRATYPALPPSARPKPVTARPSAVVNKDAVARVQAQQAALKAKGAGTSEQGGLSPHDMQSLGEGLGDALRTFRKAAEDVRGSIDPEMRTIRAEMEAAQKEVEQSIEAAKQMPAVQEDPPKT